MKMNKFAAALSLGAVVLSANVFAADEDKSSHTNMLVYADIKNDGFITDNDGNTLSEIVIELIGTDFQKPMTGSTIEAKNVRTPKQIFLTTNSNVDTTFNLKFVSTTGAQEFKAVGSGDNNIPFLMDLNGSKVANPGSDVAVKTTQETGVGRSREELKINLTSAGVYGDYAKGYYESNYSVYVSPTTAG